MGIFDKLRGKKEPKPRADFSNVQAGSSSTAAEPPKTSPLPDIGFGPSAGTTGSATTGTSGQDQTYVVVSGDSLSKIAKRYYGDANKWPRIHEANRDQIKDPDLIHPGQRLKIPGA
ncbi:MAG TPA: LysM peptidoglycan-binding domain-containing protein [Vicinamibacterales bacterium]|nr:LysM peptidoglycan-binding domain-containing protein [Vicinamibacterales bacterium]